MKTISILLGACFALMTMAMSANADTRAVYTISNIPVDKTAASPREAEAQAFADAKMIGLRRLVAKLTLPEDRAKLGDDFFSYQNANSFAQAVDVDNEKRSSTVYRAELSVIYMPNRVRAALDQAGVAYIDQQAPLSLIVPVAADGATGDAWSRAWPSNSRGALNPYVTGQGYYAPTDSWNDLAADVLSARASNAVMAELSGTQGTYSVRLIRHTGGGASVIGVTNSVASIEEAVSAASAYLDASWKRQSVIRDTSTTPSTAVVRFNDLQSWNKLRQALSASALIREFRVDAVSADGAVVSFSYAGDESRLTDELRQRGVSMTRGGSGWIMSSTFSP